MPFLLILTDLNSADCHVVCGLANAQFLADGHIHRPVSKLLAASEIITGRQSVSGARVTSGTILTRVRLEWDEEQRKHYVLSLELVTTERQPVYCVTWGRGGILLILLFVDRILMIF